MMILLGLQCDVEMQGCKANVWGISTRSSSASFVNVSGCPRVRLRRAVTASARFRCDGGGDSGVAIEVRGTRRTSTQKTALSYADRLRELSG